MAAGKALLESEAGSSLSEHILETKRQYEEELALITDEIERALKPGKSSNIRLI